MPTGRSKNTTFPGAELKAYLLPLFCLALLTVAGCYASKDFGQASSLDTPEAYREFLDKYPDNDKYSSQAEARLEMLSFEAAAKKDTYSAYRAFLSEFPLGKFFRPAQQRAEELRAEELGINLYRRLPRDFHDLVKPLYLPYRIQVRDAVPGGDKTTYVERKWYEDLISRDLFVPMDPGKAHDVSPDLTLRVRESVIRICVYPMTMVEAEILIQGNTVKSYRIAAGDLTKSCLLYEIFKDRQHYDSLLLTPEREIRAVSEQFETIRSRLPLDDSISLEFDLNQKGSEWDRETILSYVRFLEELPLAGEFFTHQRGRPPGRRYDRRIYLRVSQETHSPSIREEWSSIGPVIEWTTWNSKQIQGNPDYHFKKMTLDLIDFLDTIPGSR